jgi:drug/metabolite transporter (DMT)-like permease
VEIAFAALAAAVWGLGDFCGGRATRSLSPVAVTFAGQLLSLVPLGAVLLVLGDPPPPASDCLWGAMAGVAGLTGLALLYYALANGSMTVVAPATAVMSGAAPLVIGVASGERPSGIAVIGIVAALVAIALVTGAIGVPHAPTPSRIVAISLVSGVFLGLSLAGLDLASDESGMWPVFAMRVASVTLAAVIVAIRRPAGLSLRHPPKWALAAGLFDSTANVLFLIATREGLLSLVAVVAALYPASTICLAMGIDRERITRSQGAGLAATGLALVLVTLGR